MAYKTITFDQEGPLGIITLRRPERLNALNVQMVEDLRQAIDHIQNDDAVRVVIMTGGPDGKKRPCFCAGADMKEAPFPDTFLPDLNSLIHRIENLPKATIAAVDGVCTAGGLELAMCFDLRIMGETTRIGDLHLKNLGVGLGGAGASTRLPRLVGLANAKELIFTGDLVDGREAHRIGLANKVCPSDKLLDTAKAMGQKIAAMRLQGLAVVKAHLNLGVHMDLQESLRLADIIGPLADAEGMREIEKKQVAFATKSKEPAGQKNTGNLPPAVLSAQAKSEPIKPGIFTLPQSPGEEPRLIGAKCSSCGEIYFPFRRGTNCPHCYKANMVELPLSRTGTVLSYTIVHQPPREWQGPVPYAMALIELPEKARFYSAITGCDPAAVTIGMEVELAIEKVRTDKNGNEVTGYKFRPVQKK